MNQQGSPPPNWYPDPKGEAELRYWDGSQWTEHTHSGAAAAQPAAPPPSQAPPPQAPPPSGPPPAAAPPAGPSYPTPAPATAGGGGGGGGRTLLIVAAVVVGLLVVGGGIALLAGGGDDGGGDEADVEDAITKAVTGKEPEGCRELVTTSFIQKSTHETGSAAVSECERTRAQNTVTGVDISDVEVNGDRATATAKPTSGPASGRELELTLVKSGGDWKIDDLDQPAQADPDTAERTIITTVLNFGSSEGDKACDYLSFKKIQALGGLSGCKQAFAGGEAANYLPTDKQVTGDTATITVRETKRDAVVRFTLSRELGTWRIDDYEKLSGE